MVVVKQHLDAFPPLTGQVYVPLHPWTFVSYRGLKLFCSVHHVSEFALSDNKRA